VQNKYLQTGVKQHAFYMNEKINLGKRYEFDNSFFKEPQKIGFIKLYQVGELGCECSYQIDSHFQVCHEISYIVSGEGWFYTDGVEFKVSAGDIIINQKNHMHAIKADKDKDLRFLYLAFDFIEDDLDENNRGLVSIFENVRHTIVKDRFDMLVPFTRIMDELYNKAEFSQIMLESYINEILIITYRSFLQKKFSICLPEKSINAVGYTVYSVIRYVDENIYDIQNVKSISGFLGYSYSYLSHLFKDKMGITLQNYISLKKIEKATELIKYGRLSITQIAMKLNFEAVQAFSKSFKRATGYSPVQYQKLNKERDKI
jgi:AraC-like DNA-binding protein/mannose-6-phosphate isomerase-like protein (cupin superfamily)